MKKLYGYYGGSRLHGFPLNKNSDWDYYSIGTSSKIVPYKIYPNIKLHQKKRRTGLDVEKVELCAYMTYLMNGFVFQVESLFVPRHMMDFLDLRFDELILKNKDKLVDRCQLVENFTCNVDMVRKKTVADIDKLRKNVLASNPSTKLAKGVIKMHEEYARKGFYHRDYLHQIRMAASILYFLKNDVYPLELENVDKEAFVRCCEIKTNPDKFSRAELDEFLDIYLKQIDIFNMEDDEKKWSFNTPYVQKVISSFYS